MLWIPPMDATSRRKSHEVYWQPRSVWITSRCPGCRFATAFRKAAIQSVHGVAGRPPKQVLIEGVRDGGEGLHWLPPLNLRHPDGSFTEEWRRIYGPA